MTTVWDDTLSDSDRAVLHASNEIDRRPDLLVVGAGAVGLATALMCRRARIERVLVLDQAPIGGSASGRAAGLLTPEAQAFWRPPDFVKLALASLALHRDFDDEWGGEAGLRHLEWIDATGAPFPEQLAEWQARVIDPDAARAVDPELVLPREGILIRDQAEVHPLRFLAALARRAGTVVTGVTVTGLDVMQGKVVRVRTSRGAINPGAVVITTGVLPTGLLDRWLKLPQVLIKGHLISTEPASFELRRGVAAPILVRQLKDGRILAGSTFDFDDSGPDVDDYVVSGIVSSLQRIVPRAEHLAIEHAWCCFRPGTPDQMPVIDKVPGLANVWVSVGHFRTGLLMAPATGRALASWIGGGRRPGELSLFSAARFS